MAHGKYARSDILTNLEVMRRGMKRLATEGRNYDYDFILAQNERFVARTAPEVLEEIAGIAEGADLPYHDLLLLNLPLYIVGLHLPVDCTQVLLMPSVTEDGQTYLAKTRDLAYGWLKQLVLYRFYEDGRELIEVNTAGSVTWPGSGLNSDGLAISTSGVWSKRVVVDLNQVGQGWLLINGHILLRDSHSLEEFAERLQMQPRVSGLNIVATDTKAGAAFEATADSFYRQEAGDGFIIRTNHYLTPEIRSLAPTPNEHPSSYHRHDIAQKRIRHFKGSWNLERMINLLGDHDGYPQLSICRHAQNRTQADTTYASIAVLPSREFWTTVDYPCRVEQPGGLTAA